jgi:hypothetical protein
MSCFQPMSPGRTPQNSFQSKVPIWGLGLSLQPINCRIEPCWSLNPWHSQKNCRKLYPTSPNSTAPIPTLHQSKLKRKLRNCDVPSCCKRNASKQKGNAKDSKSNVAKKQRVPGKMTPPLQQQLPRQCPLPPGTTMHSPFSDQLSVPTRATAPLLVQHPMEMSPRHHTQTNRQHLRPITLYK